MLGCWSRNFEKCGVAESSTEKEVARSVFQKAIVTVIENELYQSFPEHESFSPSWSLMFLRNFTQEKQGKKEPAKQRITPHVLAGLTVSVSTWTHQFFVLCAEAYKWWWWANPFPPLTWVSPSIIMRTITHPECQGLSHGTDEKSWTISLGCGDTFTCLQSGLECKLIGTPLGKQLTIKRTLKTPIPFDPIVPFPETELTGTLTGMCKRQVVQCLLFVLARDGKQT